MRYKTSMRNGFTLIELLIVVAIIAILAAIAVPNFLEAQTRAKVSRAKNDERVLAQALDAYYMDNHAYVTESTSLLSILNESERAARGFKYLTTPIAYISSFPVEVFTLSTTRWGKPGAYWWYNWLERNKQMVTYSRENCPDYPLMWGHTLAYGIWSMGPNMIADGYTFYDPTNGTISSGDIIRFGPGNF